MKYCIINCLLLCLFIADLFFTSLCIVFSFGTAQMASGIERLSLEL